MALKVSEKEQLVSLETTLRLFWKVKTLLQRGTGHKASRFGRKMGFVS